MADEQATKQEEAEPQWKTLMWRLFDAAKNHGLNGDDPDHECGDLQDVAIAAWEQLTDEQAEKAFAECSDLVGAWGEEDDDE